VVEKVSIQLRYRGIEIHEGGESDEQNECNESNCKNKNMGLSSINEVGFPLCEVILESNKENFSWSES